MTTISRALRTTGLLAVFVLGVSRMAIAQGPAGAQYGPADVHFMQGMISHHAQALAMVKLIPDHTTKQAIHLVGQRIQISQKDEINLMHQWLADRQQAAPTVDSNYVAHMPGDQAGGAHMSDTGMAAHMAGMRMGGGMPLMPGMLTEDQMAQLAKAKGPEFDRLFLTDMIQHHQGAITMVADLFHTNGAGQESEIYRFSSDVDADQRAEIKRMRSLLDAMPKGAAKP